MKKLVPIISFILIIIFSGCENIKDNDVPEELKIRSFIWKGLNLYYLWQADVPDLADSKFSKQSQLNSYLGNYSNPNDLFQNLLNKPVSKFPNSGEAIDRFSVLFSDYEKLEGLLSGNTLNNGADCDFKYTDATRTTIFGWVRYVLPNSDAASKNVVRGMIFTAINNQTLTASNYQNLLSATTYTINLADYVNNNNTISITPNGQSITLTGAQLVENPVFKTSVVVNGSNKIGYLMYNGFYGAAETSLNDAFGQFKTQNITDLVLDLRYNSGGSIDTAVRLASMITGQFSGQVFGKQQWNAKIEANFNANNPNDLLDFFPTTIGNGQVINSLNLTKIYILTSKRTASASELIINGLKPYIQVVQIGDVTVGKNVGSVTLYDSPNYAKASSNPNHKYAMQPLVLKIVNKDGFGDYINGLQPNTSYIEKFDNLGILGDASEPLFNIAINQIMGLNRKHFSSNKNQENVTNNPSFDIESDMYLDKLPQGFILE